jgi:hypothetical protein
VWQGNTPAGLQRPSRHASQSNNGGFGHCFGPVATGAVPPSDKIDVKAPLNAMGAFFEGAWATTAEFWIGAPEGRFCKSSLAR